MMQLPTLTRAQIIEVDRLLVERYGLAPLQTLENGGRNLAMLARVLLEEEFEDRPLVVLAGSGVNGAGALVAARHLFNWGAWVQVVCAKPWQEYEGPAAQQLTTLQAMGAPLAWAEEGWELPPCDLLIDGLIGVGLRGEPQGKVRELILLANSSMAPILSLEAPSGIDIESGEQFMPHVRAAATLVNALPKRGMLVDSARPAFGDLYLGDIGVPASLYEELGFEIPALFARDPIVPWDVVEGGAQLLDAR